MDYHHHARLTIHRREELAQAVIQGQLSLKEAAASFKLSRQSAAKWVARFASLAGTGCGIAPRVRVIRPASSTHRWWNAWSACGVNAGPACASPRPQA